MGFKTILYDKADGVGTITLNRPEKLNAINFEMLEEMWSVLQEIVVDQEVRVVLLTGEGRFFAAGADLEILSTLEPRSLREELTRCWNPVFSIFENMPKVTIAALNGPAVGAGVELVLCCDLRYASENATLWLPQINFGVLPDAGATVRLPRIVGPARAKELILTGDTWSAPEAAAMGLVNRVLPQEGFAEEVGKRARRLAQKPPLALRLGKQLIDRALRSSDTEEGLEAVRDAQCSLVGTEDYREGVKAFSEKRGPVFRGK